MRGPLPWLLTALVDSWRLELGLLLAAMVSGGLHNFRIKMRWTSRMAREMACLLASLCFWQAVWLPLDLSPVKAYFLY